MEPFAEFMDDVFIISFAWRYWIMGALLFGPTSALVALFFRRSHPMKKGAPRDSKCRAVNYSEHQRGETGAPPRAVEQAKRLLSSRAVADRNR